MTNIEKAQEYLNNLEAEMDLAMDRVEKVPDEFLSAAHPYYAQAEVVEFATNTNNWDNLDVESYSGGFGIDIDNPEIENEN